MVFMATEDESVGAEARRPSMDALSSAREGDFSRPESGSTAGHDEKLSECRLSPSLIVKIDHLSARLERLDENVHGNYQRSLLALRERAEAAEVTLAQKFIRPMARRLALTIDSIDRFLEGVVAEEPSSIDLSSRDFIRHVCSDLVDALDDFGIEEIRADAGDPIDPKLHRVVATHGEGGGRKNRSSVVVELRRRGYSIDGWVIRPADVIAESV